MRNAEIISIESDGQFIELPVPRYQGFKGVRQELVNADRNVLGNMIKKRINEKYTLNVEWVGLTPAQKNMVVELTDPNAFGVRFFDPMDDTTRTISLAQGGMYRGSDLEIQGYGLFTGAFQWYDVKMSLVEL